MAGYLGKPVATRVLTGTDIASATVGSANLAPGVYDSFTSVTAGTTGLTVTNLGLVKVDATAGNVIINLPLANVQAAPVIKYEFKRIDSSANTVTINRSGSDVLRLGSSSVTSITMATNGDSLVLMSDGVSSWFGDSAGSLAYTPEFATSGTTTGYQKLPSGVIIQWGLVATGAPADSTATFPLQFPTACYSVVATPGVSNNLTVNIQTVTTTGFNYYRRVGATGATDTSQFYWIALGK